MDCVIEMGERSLSQRIRGALSCQWCLWERDPTVAAEWRAIAIFRRRTWPTQGSNSLNGGRAGAKAEGTFGAWLPEIKRFCGYFHSQCRSVNAETKRVAATRSQCVAFRSAKCISSNPRRQGTMAVSNSRFYGSAFLSYTVGIWTECGATYCEVYNRRYRISRSYNQNCLLF